MNRLFFIIAMSFGVAGAQAQWSVTILGPAGSTYAHSYSAFRDRQVGNSHGHAAMWSGTAASWRDLHPAGEPGSSVALAIYGDRIGGSINNRATLWTRNGSKITDCHPIDATASYIKAIGENSMAGYLVRESQPHAILWSSPSSYVDLHPSGAFDGSKIYALAGTVQVGTVSKINSQDRACKWNGTAASWTDLNPPGYSGSAIYGTDGKTHVGTIGPFGAMWKDSDNSWVYLRTYGSMYSWCYGVWEDYQVGAADSSGSSEMHAHLWRGTSESAVDLHLMLPNASYAQSAATAISSDGLYIYVSGYACSGSDETAVLWTKPGPENFYLDLNKSAVLGDNTVVGSIRMFDTRPTDTSYQTYDDSSLVTTPSVVTVPAGSISKNFLIGVNGITSTVNTTIYAKRGRLTRSHPLQLSPLVPTAVSFTPSQVRGGETAAGRVYINGVAGIAGRRVAIFDNSAYSDVPKAVTILAGATSASFSITTRAVTSAKTVTVTARVSAGETRGTLRIVP